MNEVNPLPVVFLVDPSVGVTGAFRGAQNIAAALNGSYRTILVLPKGANIASSELKKFYEVRYLRMPAMRRSVLFIIKGVPTLFYSAICLRLWLFKAKSSILHINDCYLLQGLLVRLLGFRGLIVTMIRIDPCRFGPLLAAVLLRTGAWASDVMVSVSRFIQSRLPRNVPARLLYDPVPEGLDMRLAEQPFEARQRLICIANYTPGKGQDDILTAFFKIADIAQDLTLEFHGGDLGLQKNRAWKSALEERAAMSAHRARIGFHGFAERPAAILQSAFASLNCSHSESFSLTVLEASAAGLPVIATNCGGPAEIVVDGESGYLVPVGDTAAIALAIINLSTDRRRAAEMGRKGRSLVREKFSRDVFRDELLKLYADESK